jgi:galactokinase
MPLEDAAARLREEFLVTYGRAPQWIAAAPGRVNIIGEHTDYNGGFVLPMAIEFYTLIAAAPNSSHTVNLRSAMNGESASVDLSKTLAPGARGHWTNYPKGVLAGFSALGLVLPGFDALIHSNVPVGSGLSSSAALEVAMATLLEAVAGYRLDPVDKALLCQKAEHDYAGVPCGIMDQFISTLGRKDCLLLLDCRSRQPSWVPLVDPSVAVLIVNTNVKHELASSEYSQRRRQCEAAAQALGVPSLREATLEMLQKHAGTMDAMSVRCARHVIGEINRTLGAVECINQSNWIELGLLMDASHESLKGDYAVSCAELDAVVDIAHSIGPQGGVFGCRMTGGGFGGCAVALIESAKQQAIAREIEALYLRRTGIAATLFVSRPAEGASLIVN